MRKNIFKVLIFVSVAAAGMFAFLFVAHSDERPRNHVHIHGKVATPDGSPVEGVQLRPIHPQECTVLTGLPDYANTVCVIMSGISGQGTPKTTASGQYHLVVEIGTDKYIQNVGVDKSKLVWEKENYLIVPK